MFCGGVVGYGQGSLGLIADCHRGARARRIAARSSLLTALAVLAVSTCLGARTGYSHAMYSLAIFEPTFTMVMFSALALVAYQASKSLSADYERIASTAARTSIFIINFGFWVGSLWGDPLILLRGMQHRSIRRCSTRP